MNYLFAGVLEVLEVECAGESDNCCEDECSLHQFKIIMMADKYMIDLRK